MPSWFASGSRQADSVNETWFDSMNVAVSDRADSGPPVAGADRSVGTPDAVVVSRRPAVTAPIAAASLVALNALPLILLPPSGMSSGVVRGGAGRGRAARPSRKMTPPQRGIPSRV